MFKKALTSRKGGEGFLFKRYGDARCAVVEHRGTFCALNSHRGRTLLLSSAAVQLFLWAHGNGPKSNCVDSVIRAIEDAANE